MASGKSPSPTELCALGACRIGYLPTESMTYFNTLLEYLPLSLLPMLHYQYLCFHLLIFFYLHVCVWASMCIYIQPIGTGAWRGQKRASYPETGVTGFVSHHAGAGNRTQSSERACIPNHWDVSPVSNSRLPLPVCLCYWHLNLGPWTS